MNCQKCGETLTEEVLLTLITGCHSTRLACVCSKPDCGRVHWLNGEKVVNRAKKEVYYRGEKLIHRGRDGREDIINREFYSVAKPIMA